MQVFITRCLNVIAILAGIFAVWGCGIIVFCAATNDPRGMFGAGVIALIAGAVCFGALTGAKTMNTIDRIEKNTRKGEKT